MGGTFIEERELSNGLSIQSVTVLDFVAKFAKASGLQAIMGFKENCSSIRDTIEAIKVSILTLKVHYVFEKEENYVGQHSEMKANIMLAYRHLEDARMRVGKILQGIQQGPVQVENNRLVFHLIPFAFSFVEGS